MNDEIFKTQTQTQSPRPYEVGDKIMLTVRVTETVPPKGAYVAAAGSKGNWYLTSAELDAGTLMPRPIQVGDRVTWGGRVLDYEVIAICGEEACLADGRGRDSREVFRNKMLVVPVSSLVAVLS